MKMKEKGFTLVELLAVFVILSVILGMVIINVNTYSKQQKEKDYNNLVKIIEENAKVLANNTEELFRGVNNNASNNYTDENGNVINGCKFSYDLLVDNKLMDKDTINPISNKKFFENEYYIIASIKDNKFNYELKQLDNSSSYINCREVDNLTIENMNLVLSSTSNSITAKVTVSNTLDFIRGVNWVLYDSKDNILKEASSESLIYSFSGLKNSESYKVKAKIISITNKTQEMSKDMSTLPILNPSFEVKNNPTTTYNGYLYSQNIGINYKNEGITTPTYYVKSTKFGSINNSVNISCGTGTIPSNCVEVPETTSLSENVWYKVSKDILITYNNENNNTGTIYALTYDGNNYSSSSTVTVDKIDRTAPTCSWTGESTSWTNQNRTITSICNDSGSGCKTSNYSKSYTSGTTKQANLSYTMTDNVGNTAICSKTANVYVDKEAPVIGYEKGITDQGYNLIFNQTDSGEIQSITMSGSSSASGTSTLSSNNLKTGTYTIIAKDKAGNTSKKVLRINLIAYPGDHSKWNQGYYEAINSWPIDNITYASASDSLMTIYATPSTLGWGRLASYYTINKIDITNYDLLESVFYSNAVTTSTVLYQQLLNGSMLSQAYASTASGGWLKLSSDISKYNSNYQIILTANGGADTTISAYIAIVGLFSVRDN